MMVVGRRRTLRAITQESVDAWAELSDDFNPLHTDPEFAARAQFGQTICHGHLIVALVTRALEVGTGEPVAPRFQLLEARFLKPVLVGKTYQFASGVDSSSGGRFHLAVEDEAGTPVFTATAALGQRTPDPGDPSPSTGRDTVPDSGRPAGQPVLWSDELHTGRSFRPLSIRLSHAQARRFYALVGGDPSDGMVPAGFAAAIARWSYLRDFTMPPGAVMLGMELDVRRSMPLNVDLSLTAAVVFAEDRGQNRRIRIRSEAVVDGRPANVAELLIRWPKQPLAELGDQDVS